MWGVTPLSPLQESPAALDFLVAPHGLWDLSSLTRDRARASCIASAESTAGPPGKSCFGLFLRLLFPLP